MSEEIIETLTETGMIDLTEVRRPVKKIKDIEDTGISTILGEK